MRPLTLFSLLAASATFDATAQPITELLQPQGVLSLSATASLEVPRDVLTIVFSTTREGADAALVQAQLTQALDAALFEARKAARPGQVDLQAGNFALSPRYGKTGITGWQGSTELVVEGRDMAAISQLAGRITTLTVARVGYGLSREVRAKAEADASAQAIARYRAKAADYARQFGYAGYAIREVNVNASEPGPVRPMMAQARATMAMAAEDPLPVEAGKGAVTVSVNGTIQMK